MRANGTYSIIVSSESLSSIGFIAIDDGVVRGNDNLGSTFEGWANLVEGGTLLKLDVCMSTPPDIYRLLSGCAREGQFQLRSIGFTVLLSEFASGRPFQNDSHDITIIARKLSQDYAPLAGEKGRWHQIELLRSADLAWKERE